jgi:hypothetical protein
VPSILEQSQELVKQKVEQLATEDRDEMKVGVDLQKIELSISKSWNNGWGLVAWARKYWAEKSISAGGQITKKL